jgi:hypothetical protein
VAGTVPTGPPSRLKPAPDEDHPLLTRRTRQRIVRKPFGDCQRCRDNNLHQRKRFGERSERKDFDPQPQPSRARQPAGAPSDDHAVETATVTAGLPHCDVRPWSRYVHRCAEPTDTPSARTSARRSHRLPRPRQRRTHLLALPNLRRRCTGRHSTLTAQPWKGQHQCGSPPTASEAFAPPTAGVLRRRPGRKRARTRSAAFARTRSCRFCPASWQTAPRNALGGKINGRVQFRWSRRLVYWLTQDYFRRRA